MSDFDTVFRYEVPVDDAWHIHELSGNVLHVAGRKRGVVEFWARATHGPLVARSFRVYGTGHPMPVGLEYHGSVLDGPLVWHLMEDAG